MTQEPTEQCDAPCVATAIFAWNEERSIAATLQSLFQQSLFAELTKCNQRCEIICVANGCTDRTASVASEFFNHNHLQHPNHASFTCAVANLPERGKVNAWNQFVHALSSKSARVLFMMDADILIHRADTL